MPGCGAGLGDWLSDDEEEDKWRAQRLAEWQAESDRKLGRCCIGWYPQRQLVHIGGKPFCEITYTRMVRVGSRQVAKPCYASACFVPIQQGEGGSVRQNDRPYTGRDAYRMDQRMAVEKASETEKASAWKRIAVDQWIAVEISGKASASNRGWRAGPDSGHSPVLGKLPGVVKARYRAREWGSRRKVWVTTNWSQLRARDRRPFVDFERREVALWHWALLREWFRTRTAALYWQESTQRRLCAEFGPGRAQDADAFQEAFCA